MEMVESARPSFVIFPSFVLSTIRLVKLASSIADCILSSGMAVKSFIFLPLIIGPFIIFAPIFSRYISTACVLAATAIPLLESELFSHIVVKESKSLLSKSTASSLGMKESKASTLISALLISKYSGFCKILKMDITASLLNCCCLVKALSFFGLNIEMQKR